MVYLKKKQTLVQGNHADMLMQNENVSRIPEYCNLRRNTSNHKLEIIISDKIEYITRNSNIKHGKRLKAARERYTIQRSGDGGTV